MNYLKEPLVSIIIVNYNGLKHLKECFDSLNNLTYRNFEIIFVDNGSQDKSVEFVSKNYQKVKIVHLDKNYGFSGGNNVGASRSKGKYLALLNNDTRVDKNWLIELIKVAQDSREIGIVASKVYYYDNKEILDYAGGVCDKYGNIKHIGSLQTDHNYLNTQKETFYGSGAALLIKRELYEKVGLFDPFYFAYYEDIDICWKAWISGYKVVYAPKSFIYHKTCQVLKKQYKRIFFLNERNRLRTLLKNYKIITFLRILPGYLKRRLVQLLNLIYHFDKYTITFINNYIKVIFWNIFHINSLIKNRKIISTYRKREDKDIIQLMEKISSI